MKITARDANVAEIKNKKIEERSSRTEEKEHKYWKEREELYKQDIQMKEYEDLKEESRNQSVRYYKNAKIKNQKKQTTREGSITRSVNIQQKKQKQW